MKGQKIGYIRVRTLDQNPERQLKDVVVDRIFLDNASGKDITRPQLEDFLLVKIHRWQILYCP